ncbi:hypothetical protein GRX03_15110 [Halovenus sp. WSH3]|uniref:Uncharacterized protein n=1 Tax=Halovenus carboxidivorans TaxID=2692199 RepID=A0A6B0T7K8_9EURY|nr:hypothetical protein [Halovenus carboxidivorans]MXR52927.1 hypothetical protein [Halovenus carboxidivorans]
MSHGIESLAVCLDRDHVIRTAGIALLVGTWLTLFNHATALLGLELSFWVRITLNYLTPLTVANLGLIARQTGSSDH